jgi:outer membrane autotransporter protein
MNLNQLSRGVTRALVLFTLTIFGASAQAQLAAIGETVTIDNIQSFATRLSAQFPVSTPAGTVITWTELGSATPSTITTTVYSAPTNNLSTLTTNIPAQGLTSKISACLPGSAGPTDSTACAFFRFVGCANPNSPAPVTMSRVGGGSVSVEYTNRLANGQEPLPRSGINVNWSVPIGGGTLSTTSSTSGATGAAAVLYIPGQTGSLQRLRATPQSSNLLCNPAGSTTDIDINVTGINSPPSVQIVVPDTDVSVVIGSVVRVFLQAADIDGTVTRVDYNIVNTATGASVFTGGFPIDPAKIGTDLNFTWSTTEIGRYALTVTATDNGGAVSRPSPARIITVTPRNQLPVASIVQPDRDVIGIEGTSLRVRVQASDPDTANPVGPRGGISNVVARAVNTATNTEAWTQTTSTESPQNPGNYDLVWPNLPIGRYSITALAFDNLGEASPVTAARVVTVVAADPGTINLSSPAGGQVFAFDKDIAIVARANPPTSGAVRTVTATITPSGGTQTGVTVSLASRPGTPLYEGTWKPTTAGDYRVLVTATFSAGPTRSDAAIITISPAPIKAATLTVLNEAAIAIKPGQPVAFDIVAKDAQGAAAPGQILRWALAIKPGSGTPDSATGGDVTTDASGTARIAFTAGTSMQDRTFNVFVLSDPSVNKSVVLKSAPVVTPPIKTVSIVGKSIVAAPNQSQIVTVVAIDTAKLPIEGIAIDWFLEPANSGILAVINDVTNAAGESRASFTLLPLAKGTLVKACPRGSGSSSDKCARFVIKNTVTELTQPVQAIVTPAATQSAATSRVQVGQVRTRFQQLRNEQTGGYRNDVGVTVDGGRIPLPTPENVPSESSDRKISGASIKGNRWGSFSVGDIDVSRATGDGGYEVSTRGLTIGVDYRLTPSVVVGAAFGGLRGKTTSDGTAEQRARGVSGSLFAQWFAPGEFYVNTVINHGRNTYDLRRFATPEIRIDSETQSNQTALQVEGGYNYVRENLSVSPYLRVEHVRAAIDGINEPGTFDDAIKTSASTLRAYTVALGLQADAKFSTRTGVWIPGLRVEYLSERQRQSASTAELVNALLVNGSPLITTVPVPGYDNSYGNAGLSLQWLTGIGAQPISLFFGFDTTFGKSGVSTKRFSAGVKVPL